MPKLIVNKDEIYGTWKILMPYVIDPNCTAEKYKGKPLFSLCLCTCCNKTIKYIRNSDLKKYAKSKCRACTIKEQNEKKRTIKVGDVFGHLTVIGDGGADGRRHYSICQCDCKNQTVLKVQDNRLKTGNTKSCGCISSRGEDIIRTLLDQHNILYDYDKMFMPLFRETGRRLRFDFVIYNNNGDIERFVEFDGNQHKTGMWGGSWHNLETLEVITERDNIKNQYCLTHNYKLIRIPYSLINTITIDDILTDKYLIKE